MAKVFNFQHEKINLEHTSALKCRKITASCLDDHMNHIIKHTKFLNYLLNLGIINGSSKIYKNIIFNIREHQEYLSSKGFVYNFKLAKLEAKGTKKTASGH